MFPIFAWLYFLYQVPQPVVNWVTSGKESIDIVAEGREELLDRCVDAGIEVRYRFAMRYCTKGSFWFDDCEDEFVHIKNIRFDPIKENYSVESDSLGDNSTPEVDVFTDRSEAINKLKTLSNLRIKPLSRGRQIIQDKDYIGIRVLSECKGSVGSTLLDMSYYLTFGLVKVSRFDSGWVAFYLKQ